MGEIEKSAEDALDIDIDRDKLLKIWRKTMHDFANPLCTMSFMLCGFEDILPILLKVYKGYKDAKKDNLDDSEFIQNRVLDVLYNSVNIMRTQVSICSWLLEVITMQIKPIELDDNMDYMISDCVNEAIEQYPNFYERFEYPQIIKNNIKDFKFRGSKNVIKHVIFNLLENASYAFKIAQKGEIFLTVSKDKDFNYLHFKDTACGISKNDIKHIFDKYYTTAENKLGLGLHFCKRAMLSLNGDIRCQSKKGRYAEFILKFPKNR